MSQEAVLRLMATGMIMDLYDKSFERIVELSDVIIRGVIDSICETKIVLSAHDVQCIRICVIDCITKGIKIREGEQSCSNS